MTAWNRVGELCKPTYKLKKINTRLMCYVKYVLVL